MACRKGALREEGKIRNAAAAAASLGDALLFATMCIIGMTVDVHAKDGSVFSGIFHTASVDKDYAIVLKKARMIKKGRLNANVVSGTLIETLVVHSEDLVQVVSKGVILPSDGMAGYAGRDDMEAVAGYTERDAGVVKTNESKGNFEHSIQSRLSVKSEEALRTANPLGNQVEDYSERSDARHIEKIQIEEDDNVFENGRLAGNVSQERQRDGQNPIEFQGGEAQNPSLSITTCEAQSASAANVQEEFLRVELQEESSGHSSALEDMDQEKTITNGTASTEPINCVASTPIINVKSESSLSASSNPFRLVHPKGSSAKRSAKESKLNPGAKMFCPSILHRRTVTPAVPNAATDSYLSRTYLMAPTATGQEDVDGSSFTHSSVPVKFVPYDNIAFGHGDGVNDSPYVQPVIGQVVNKIQPVRYTAQYQNMQTSYAYVHPHSQNVMLGRGPLACMHPVSSDFSPAAMRPVSTLHQMHQQPKHQGNSSAQALQLCMNPPIMANAALPFIVPNSVPISQPLFPVLRPIAVPGTNGFLSPKFV